MRIPGVRLRRPASILLAFFMLSLPGVASADSLDETLIDTASPSSSALRRWLGAEAGWDEIACTGGAVGCPGLSFHYAFEGSVGTRRTMLDYQDPDGVVRKWPSRTGNRLWLAGVPGGNPSLAYMSTSGSRDGGFSGGTLSLSFRVPVLPSVPVAIYRHDDPDLLKTLTITLTPQGEFLVMLGASSVGFAETEVSPFAWHNLTLSYGPDITTLKLWFDGNLEVNRSLKEGGPGGDVSFGVVAPTTVPFAIGFDDYVESKQADAPILGARVQYMIPKGPGGTTEWEKFPFEPSVCFEAAENWQLVSEDHRESPPGSGISCSFDGLAVTTSEAGVVDEYKLEGIPSSHVPSTSYFRDVSIQPRVGDAILGVRTRMLGASDGAPVTMSLSIVDGPGTYTDFYTYEGAQSYQLWGPTYDNRPGGGSWAVGALNGLRLRLGSGDLGLIARRVGAVRLDYVWAPGFYTGG